MALLGLPNAVLWGVLAGLVNFIPYIGPLIGIAVISAESVVQFSTIGEMAAPPAVYLGLNCLEGFLVTPVLLGRRLTLNPVVLFIWLLFWSWIWGVPGALLAVPLLCSLKIVFDNVPGLDVYGSFLGEDPTRRAARP